AQLREKNAAQVGERAGSAASRLGRIEPTAVLAEEYLVNETGVEGAVDERDEGGVGAGFADAVVFEPGAPAGRGAMAGEIGFGVRVDPDEASGRTAGRLHDVELGDCDLTADRVAADGGAGCRAGRRRCAQHLRFGDRQTLVARADLDPSGLDTAVFDLPG